MSVGGPQSLALDAWANRLKDIFRDDDCWGVYQVGSSVKSKGWRDVDVVVILDDEAFVRWFGDWPGAGHRNDPKWAALCSALSAWGTAETGLPIDLKVQGHTDANKRHPNKIRSFLGMYVGPPAPDQEATA